MQIVAVLLWIASATALLTNSTAHGAVTLESLLKEMVSYDAAARWPQPEFTCKQASSYDRASVASDKPGWFANSDQNQFIREERIGGHTEKVMMDVDGPGCIVRFWLTTDRNKQGTIRIYLDGAEEPTIIFPAYDLLSGDLNIGTPLTEPHPGYSPDGNGGNNFYLPIPYAKHCKVTWEEKSQGARYYQINYRTYTAGTAVKTFSRADLETVGPLVREVNRTLLSPAVAIGAEARVTGEIPSASELSLKLPAGSKAVRLLEVKVTPSLTERELRSLVLVMVCDGATNIWCPVTDFFGSGVGLNVAQSWYRTVAADGSMNCRWVMPYRKSAELKLLNLNQKPVTATLNARCGSWDWDERTMCFHAAWHYEGGLQVPPNRDWNFISITGRGVYVGDTLALFNPNAAWYGEGDEKIWVDGESFPSHFGTGTEDYYGYSYAPKPVHQTPFCGEPRLDQPQTQGHNTSIRSRNLDGIPFQKSLRFDMELLPWRPGALTYAATTYWYAFPGTTSNRQPQPDGATQPVPTLADAVAASAPKHFAGAIECEKLKVLKKSGDLSVSEQDMAVFDATRWSGGAQLFAESKTAGEFLEIEVPAPADAAYRMVIHLTQAPDYGQLQFSVNGQAVVAKFDGYADKVQPAAALDLGVFKTVNRAYTLGIKAVGANPNSTGAKYFFGLDYIELAKP